jgi:hypothetical protein
MATIISPVSPQGFSKAGTGQFHLASTVLPSKSLWKMILKAKGKTRNCKPFSNTFKYKPVPTNKVSIGGLQTQPYKMEMSVSKEIIMILFSVGNYGLNVLNLSRLFYPSSDSKYQKVSVHRAD